MSNTPEPDINLDLHFLPAWARQPSEINRYAHYEGQDRAERRGGARRQRFDGLPREGFSREGAPRDRSREERGPRPGGRPGDRRAGPPRGRERSGRPEHREEAPPLPNVRVSFVPEPRGVESLARQIKLTGRAYPMFEIAQLILSKPERYQVALEVVKAEDGTPAQELWHCSIDNTLWLSMEEAVGHVFRRHFELFYQAEKTPTDPPKGTYTFVAQCGLSGTILGPPNYHDYQVKLRKLHASRYSRMPFAVYQAKVRIVRDEAVVKQWMEDQSFTTEYVCLNVPEPLKLANREEAEKHFREVHAATLIRSVDSWTSPGAVAQQSPSSMVRQVVRAAWEEQQRFPLRVVTVLSQQMAGHGLQFFKVNKTVTHVCVARPHYLNMDEVPVSDGVRRIVEYVREHERCSRRDLVEALAPTPPRRPPTPPESQPPPTSAPEAPAPAAAETPADGQGTEPPAAAPVPTITPVSVEDGPTPEQTAVVGDLHWLIHQGHLIEFANGRLESAKQPKPQPEHRPKPTPARSGPAVQPAESGAAVETPAEAPVEGAPTGAFSDTQAAASASPMSPTEGMELSSTPPSAAASSEVGVPGPEDGPAGLPRIEPEVPEPNLAPAEEVREPEKPRDTSTAGTE